LGEPAIWRDIRVVTIGIAPSWAKDDEAFLARRVVLNIENIGGNGMNEKTRQVKSVSPIWDRLYARHVLNYESLDLPHLERGTGDRFIVVSRTLFEDVAPQFVEWKTEQGYGVDLVTLEDLGHSNPSADDAMDGVKNYILQAYNDWPETP